jgi:Carbohydrate esterase, sialic acid-specific acetylesterase
VAKSHPERLLLFRLIAAVLFLFASAAPSRSSAQVLPERDACRPATSSKSRDADCVACKTGPISTRASFIKLVETIRSRKDMFGDVDRRIDAASNDPAVVALLKGRTLARALYGSDGDFIAGGNASRCLMSDNEAALRRATALPCDQIPRDGLAVLLTAGQSNISNTGSPERAGSELYQPHNVFYNFDRFDGKCYVARNPALGTPGEGENVAVRLGDELIDRKLYKNVLIAPVAIGGTYLEEWRPRGGKYFEIVLATLAGLRDNNLEPTSILWHQGEFNAIAFTTSGAEDGTKLTVTTAMKEAGRLSYIRNYLEIIAGLRAADVAAPIFVATATICGAGPDEIIRSAQASVPNPALGVYAGPDTDSIGSSLRSDGCHMTRAGTEQHARLWADRLAEYLVSHPERQP